MGCISDGMLESKLSVGMDSVCVTVSMLDFRLSVGTDCVTGTSSVSVVMLISLCSPSDGVTYGRLDCCMDG